MVSRLLLAVLVRTGLLDRVIHWYAVRRALRPVLSEAWRSLGATIDPTAYVGPGTDMRFPEHVVIGAGTGLQGTIWLDAWGTITIGANVLMNQDVKILSAGHDVHSPNFDGDIRPIRIDDYAWLPHDVVVLPGVHIGRAAVIGTGSVVTRDVPERAIVAGNPARQIGERADVEFTYKPAG